MLGHPIRPRVGRRYTVRSYHTAILWRFALFDKLQNDFVLRSDGHFWKSAETRGEVWEYIRKPLPKKDEAEWKLREVELKLDRGKVV
jgi:hypothetical protein